MKKLKPEDKLAAELEKIIRAAQTVLCEYHAATSKRQRARKVVMIDPRTNKKMKR